ncbi:hypothetical protein VTK26DRAFT_6666 [Humicola hyalothermophila]
MNWMSRAAEESDQPLKEGQVGFREVQMMHDKHCTRSPDPGSRSPPLPRQPLRRPAMQVVAVRLPTAQKHRHFQLLVARRQDRRKEVVYGVQWRQVSQVTVILVLWFSPDSGFWVKSQRGVNSQWRGPHNPGAGYPISMTLLRSVSLSKPSRRVLDSAMSNAGGKNWRWLTQIWTAGGE